MEEVLKPEIIALVCIRPVLVALAAYAFIIASLEIDGNMQGYSGLGQETHERVIELIKKRLPRRKTKNVKFLFPI